MKRLVVLLLLASALLFAACSRRQEPKPLYPVSEFSLTDQTGARFGSAELRGKTWVAAFFFTRCPTICPKIMRRMKAVGDEAKSRGLELELVSISVDPENDSPAVLAEYARKNGYERASWHFLTGDYEQIKKTAVDGFKQALEGKADPAAPDYGILHGSHLVLVDKAGQIRGYYRTSDDAEMKRLVDDLGALQK